MTDRPKSRRPDTWPPKIREVLLRATRTEQLIPFETTTKLAAFKKLLLEFRRSYREHNHADSPAIQQLKAIEYATSTIIESRPDYRADPLYFPFTLLISPDAGFTDNLDAAQSPSEDHTIPLPPPIEDLELAALQIDLERTIREEATDDNEAAEFFRSRRTT